VLAANETKVLDLLLRRVRPGRKGHLLCRAESWWHVATAILIYLMLGKWVLAMPRFLDPLRFVLISVAGWMSQRHLQAH
jgi:hypothetical protein